MENINLEKLAGIVKRLPILLVIASAINDREDPETRYIYTQGKRPLTDKEELVDPKESTYLIHCPFHGGGLGSFVITPQKNMWWCFVESEGWSTIDFERKYYDCAGFDDAVIHLAERFNIIRRGQDIHDGIGGKAPAFRALPCRGLPLFFRSFGNLQLLMHRFTHPPFPPSAGSGPAARWP